MPYDANRGVRGTQGYQGPQGPQGALSAVLVITESMVNINADGRQMGTINQTAATNTPSSQAAHLRTMDVIFPAGWVGGTVTVVGTAPDGSTISEAHATPGPGGGTSSGVKVFALVTRYDNSAPVGGPSLVATVNISSKLGVANHPVTEFVKVTVQSANDSFSATDLVNGTFDTVAAHGGNKTVEVWYTITI